MIVDKYSLDIRLKDGSHMSGKFMNVAPTMTFKDFGMVMHHTDAASLVEKTVEKPIARGAQAAGLIVFVVVDIGSHHCCFLGRNPGPRHRAATKRSVRARGDQALRLLSKLRSAAGAGISSSY